MIEHKKHPHDAVIRAWLDGKAVQWRPSTGGDWMDCATVNLPGTAGGPGFLYCAEYRIKPETIRYRVAMMNAYPSIVYPKDYDILERSYGFIRWLGPEQEVEV